MLLSQHFIQVTSEDTLDTIAEKYNISKDVVKDSLKGKSLSDLLKTVAYHESLRERALKELEIKDTDSEDAKTKKLGLSG